MNIISKIMKSGPFLRGFLPGVVIGVFSSVLLFSLWRDPLFTSQGSTQILVPLRIGVNHQESEKERRDVQGQFDHLTGTLPDTCNTTFLQNRPVERSCLLLVLIHSSAGAVELRNTVRVTWLKEHRHQQRYVARFVIGTAGLDTKTLGKLACENREYGDLLLVSDIDDKDREDWPSSEKLLKSFVWAIQNVDFFYILKCNDATFVILERILKGLENRHSTSDYLWGYFAGGIQATKEGRFAEKNWFLCSHYLPFPQGGGYVISRDLVEMLTIMEHDLEHYDHDDIALGVWLSPFDGIQKRHDVRFNTGYYSRGCNNAYIVTHRETKESMLQKFSMFQRMGFICEEEFQSRLSYVYNWTAPASKCCVRKPGIP